jgi:hypothetical protein
MTVSQIMEKMIAFSDSRNIAVKVEIKATEVLQDRKNPRNLNEIGGFLMAKECYYDTIGEIVMLER